MSDELENKNISESAAPRDFIRQIIDEDLRTEKKTVQK
jgi:hypothetical protein